MTKVKPSNAHENGKWVTFVKNDVHTSLNAKKH